jgi:hypothetical protein
MIEQRKHQRFDLRLPFELLSPGDRNPLKGETRNVSSSGVLFTSDRPLPLGEPVEYLITFPKAPSARVEIRLRCVGKVVREEPQTGYAASLERYEFMRESV